MNTLHNNNIIAFNPVEEKTEDVKKNTPSKILKFNQILSANKVDLDYMIGMLELYKDVTDKEENPDYIKIDRQVFKLKSERDSNHKQIAKKLLKNSSQKEIEWPDVITNDDGDVIKIKTTKDNTEYLLVKKKGFSVKFNELKKEIEFDINQDELDEENIKKNIENHDNSGFLFHCRDICEQNNYNVSFEILKQHIYLISRENRYHPVKDYLNGLPAWDGHDYIKDLFNTITINEDHIEFIELYETFLRKWLVQSVFCMLCGPERKFNAAGVLVFHGVQGKGKTTWMSRLSPNQDWFKEAMALEAKDKDDVAIFIQHWIVELGEIDATFRKSDIAVLKGFITNHIDQFRPPYGASTQKYKRETVCCGSVNDIDFLKDDENRRFWVMSCDSIDAFHKIDINKVWSQSKHLFENEFSFYLNSEELQYLHSSNENFRVISPIEELMIEKGVSSKPFDILKPDEFKHTLGIMEFFKKVLKIPEPNQYQLREFRRYATKINLKFRKNKRHYTFYYKGELYEESKKSDNNSKLISSRNYRNDYDND